MNRSESIVNLSKGLFKFQSNVSSIKKDANNPFFKSKYASLSNILDEIDAFLTTAGLVIIQPPVESKADGLVTVLTMLIHAETGEFMESEFSMKPVKSDPQGIGSCITYMRRYALTSILKLNVEDDDGNDASNVKKDSGRLITKNDARFMELKEKIELSETKNELAKIVPDIQSGSISDEERAILRNLYKEALEKVK